MTLTTTPFQSDSLNGSPISKQKDSSVTKCLQSPKKKISKSKETGKRKNGYRAEGMNWLLTYPQCSLTKEAVINNLKSKENLELVCVIAAREKHADGNYHLHVIVCLKTRLRTRDPTFWDFVALKHGDYKVVKKPKDAYAYVTKEDKDPMIYGTVPGNFSGLKRSKSDECAEMILSGCTTAQVVAKMPGFSLMNLVKINSFKSYVSSVYSTKSKPVLTTPITYDGEDEATKCITEWLNGNLFGERPFKQEQLWICGPPNCLKTSLLMKLEEYFRLYPVPQGEDFLDTYDDSCYDIIVFDEFKAEKTITFLNRFITGGLPMCCRTKGGQVWKKKNLPVIFCSNYTMAECYHKANSVSLAALRARIKEVVVYTPIDLDNIVWTVKASESEKDELIE